MKFALVTALAAALILFGLFLIPTQGARAVEDLGEQNVFAAACRSILDVGRASGIDVVKCRRTVGTEDEMVSPFSAVVHVTVWDRDKAQYHLDVYLNKSLWSVAAFNQTG